MLIFQSISQYKILSSICLLAIGSCQLLTTALLFSNSRFQHAFLIIVSLSSSIIITETSRLNLYVFLSSQFEWFTNWQYLTILYSIVKDHNFLMRVSNYFICLFFLTQFLILWFRDLSLSKGHYRFNQLTLSSFGLS